jgi:hypothetical protein
MLTFKGLLYDEIVMLILEGVVQGVTFLSTYNWVFEGGILILRFKRAKC